MKSLRGRLAIWSACISGLILLLYVVGDTFELYEDTLEYIDAEIVQTGGVFLEDAARSDDRVNFEAPLDAMILDDWEYLLIVKISSPDGEVYARRAYPDSRDSSKMPVPGKFSTITLDDDDAFRVGTVSKDGWTGTFAVDYDIVTEEIVESVLAFLVILPGVLLTAAIGGWWIGRLALKPIREITQAAEEITASGLDCRLPIPEINGEIARLVEVLNAMLGRLESSFKQASRFTADASHQLRTPLTILQNEIDSALNAGTISEEQQELLIVLMEEVQRLKTIVESLLILSRSDAGNLRLHKQSFDFSDMLEELVEDTRMLGETLNLTVEMDIPEKVTVDADEILIRQCVMNLLDNAVKYNRLGGRIHGRLVREEDQACLTLFNTGHHIQTDSQERIFDRFFRDIGAAESGTKGFGLGLSLVLEILKAHGGSISLARSVEDATEFVIKLPIHSI